jgi:hypothetical protein
MNLFASHRRWFARTPPWAATLLVAGCWVADAAQAQTSSTQSRVFTCVAADGRRLTSDRPIPQCVDREQRQLGRDGSLVRVLPPSYTAEERAAREAAEQKAAAERAAQADAARIDRNLQRRYPNEAAHNKARAGALADVQAAIDSSKKRLDTLAVERKPLELEAEFYKGKTIPIKLKRQIDANDVARQAIADTQVNNEAELKRVNANYDLELERLRKLWAGAAQGTLGPLTLAEKPAPKPATKPGVKAVSTPASGPAKPAAASAAKR